MLLKRGTRDWILEKTMDVIPGKYICIYNSIEDIWGEIQWSGFHHLTGENGKLFFGVTFKEADSGFEYTMYLYTGKVSLVKYEINETLPKNKVG